MTTILRTLAFAGAALAASALPALAQDININPLGLDLDPFHIFTPAPPPPPPPGSGPVGRHHHHRWHHGHHHWHHGAHHHPSYHPAHHHHGHHAKR